MAVPIREQQRLLLRETILRAVADHVSKTGSLEFSLTVIAQAAGVSERTIYNHFGSREGLIDAMAEWTEAAIRERGSDLVPRSMETIDEWIRLDWEFFEEVAPLAEAFARADAVVGGTSRHRERTQAYQQLVRDRYPKLSERQTLALAAALRQLAGVRNWYVMTREFSLTTPEAAATASWLAGLMAQALRAGAAPFHPDDEGDASDIR